MKNLTAVIAFWAIWLIAGTAKAIPLSDLSTISLSLPEISSENSYQVAGVCWLAKDSGCGREGYFDRDDANDNLSNDEYCKMLGLSKNTCNEAQIPMNPCDKDSSYNAGCRCRTDLLECAYPSSGGGTECGGKYTACVCSSSLKECSDKEVGSGQSCWDGSKTLWETCSCNTSKYNRTCVSPQTSNGDTCGGKSSGCNCPTSYLSCTEKGPAPGATTCQKDNGTVVYSSCKTGCDAPEYDPAQPFTDSEGTCWGKLQTWIDSVGKLTN